MPWSGGRFDTGSLSDGEREQNRVCQREHRSYWVVEVRNGNYSAFNGYHFTPSEYSQVRCTRPGCDRIFRTRAAYVAGLPDAR